MRWIVYETRCLVSGKIYVGVHRQDGDGFDGYLGSGTALARAIKKHGVENFVRRTLEEFSAEAEAYAREAEIVTEEFCKRRDTYNMKPGGIGAWPAGFLEKQCRANLGSKRSPEQRERMRQAQNTPEAREWRRKAHLGKKRSPEARERMSQAHSTPEARERNRQANLGRKKSPEARENMRRAQGTPEARERNRQANLGRKKSPEVRENMRRAQGTPEARERKRQAALRQWAERRAHAA